MMSDHRTDDAARELLSRRFGFLAGRYERQYEAARAGRPCDFVVGLDTSREAGETVARARDAGFLHLPGLPDATEWLAAEVDSPGPDRPAVLVRNPSNYWLLALGCLHRKRPDAFPGLGYLAPEYADAWTADTRREYRADTAWADADASRLLAGMVRDACTDATKDDTKNDIGKKREKKSRPRPMNAAAADCARRYRAEGGIFPMKTVVGDYVAEHGGSVASLMRILNDNPGQWKDDTNTT